MRDYARFYRVVAEWRTEAEVIERKADQFEGQQRSRLRADADQIRYCARFLELTIINAENDDYMESVSPGWTQAGEILGEQTVLAGPMGAE